MVSARPCGLDEADHHVDALPAQAVALLEHLVGLADAGGEAEIDFQPPALLLADQVEEALGVGLRFVVSVQDVHLQLCVRVWQLSCGTTVPRCPARFRTRPCRRGP